MAKRLTDTTKWVNPSFRKIKSKYKLLYLYILDNCDCSGVMHLDLEVIGFLLSEEFLLSEVKEIFSSKITFVSSEKIIVNNFIAFQNGDISDSKSPMARSICTALNSHGLLEKYRKGDFGHINKAVSIFDSHG